MHSSHAPTLFIFFGARDLQLMIFKLKIFASLTFKKSRKTQISSSIFFFMCVTGAEGKSVPHGKWFLWPIYLDKAISCGTDLPGWYRFTCNALRTNRSHHEKLLDMIFDVDGSNVSYRHVHQRHYTGNKNKCVMRHTDLHLSVEHILFSNFSLLATL